MTLNKTIQVLLSIFLILLQNNLSAAITSISPKSIIGGIGQIVTITGTGFGSSQGINYVSFLQESGSYLDAAGSKALKYKSWIDSKIEIEMPFAFSGRVKINIGGIDSYSADTLRVNANLGYRALNPLDYNFLNNTNGKGGYTWYMHRLYWNDPAIKAAIEAVFKEFRCKTGVNYILANTPSDSSLKLSDNINLIAPDSALGAVGYTDMAWSSCILGGTTFYRSSTMDVRMSTKQNWHFGTGATPAGKSKFRYVLMHELGHSLGLGHVNENGQTMYPSVTLLPSDTWNSRDSITKDEKTAISYFVNLSQNFSFRACGITPISPIGDCNDVYGVKMGVDERIDKPNITLYPNPTNGVIYLKTDVENFDIFNSMGKSISFITLESEHITEINLIGNPPGIYIMMIKKDNKVLFRKIFLN